MTRDNRAASVVDPDAGRIDEEERSESAHEDHGDNIGAQALPRNHKARPHHDPHFSRGRVVSFRRKTTWQSRVIDRFAEVNKELWLVLSMMIIAVALNYLVASHRIILGFYALPTLLSAYFYGRRHAVLTALASVLLVSLLAHINSNLFAVSAVPDFDNARWYELFAWGGILLVTAFAMGTLYEKQKARLNELQHTYRGLLLILRQFVAKDKYTENHCYRVSIYASKVAARMGFPPERIEDVKAASLIHDIGKLDTSRELLYKAARLTAEEFQEVKKHADKGVSMLEPVGGPLHRIIPIILAHHEKFDGSGYHAMDHSEIPLESRIIAVADAYDSLTSDRPYRKAVAPFEAKNIIADSAGTDFDPDVVDAFLFAFSRGEMEVPELVL